MAPEFQPLVPYFINFAIVLVMVFVIARKPLHKFIYQRHERMRDAIETAALAHGKAASRAEAARRALGSLGSEEQAIFNREIASAEQEKKEILDKALAEAQRVLREAERLAAVEQDEAADRVKGQFLDLVIGETEGKLKSSLKKDDHSAILKRAQNSIEVGV